MQLRAWGYAGEEKGQEEGRYRQKEHFVVSRQGLNKWLASYGHFVLSLKSITMAAMPVPVARSVASAPVQFRQRKSLHTRGSPSRAALTTSSARSTRVARESRVSRREVRCLSSKPTSTATDEPAESAGDKSREEASSTAVSESAASSTEETSKAAVTDASIDSIGAELARLRKAKEEAAEPSGAGGFILGVLEEVRLIEWPGFSSVVSTTGLVLAVIVSATIAILIVNAILSEISDAIFSIKAVADLWGL